MQRCAGLNRATRITEDGTDTTNLPFESWTEVLGSERLTGATLDRLTHRCHILETRGESYRLKDAKRRRQPMKKKDHRDDAKEDK